MIWIKCGTHVPLIVVGTGRWDGVMGVTSDVYPPSQEGGQRRKKGARGSGLANLTQNKHSLCLPSCRRTEGSGCNQQGTKFVSCLIFLIAKRMLVSALLTQVPEKREKFSLHINVPSSLSLLRRDYSPGGLCLLKFPHVQLYARSRRGYGESFLNSPQVLWVG